MKTDEVTTLEPEEIEELNFFFLSGHSKRQFNHMKKLEGALAKLEYVSTKEPLASEWMDFNTDEIFWRPKFGDIHIALDSKFPKFDSIDSAYKEALRLQELMLIKIDYLKNKATES